MKKPGKVESLFSRYGIRKTKQRCALFEVLRTSSMPLTAAQIQEQLIKKDPEAWISTTYRALEMFTQKGLVKKTTLQGPGLAVYELSSNGHKHYAVCQGCSKIIPLKECPIIDYVPHMQEGFHMTGHNLELYGYCDRCYEKHKGDN